MSARRLAAGLAVALTLTGLAACGTADTPNPSNRSGSTMNTPTSPSNSPSNAKTGTGEVRHDLDPLTKRFSAIGTPLSATWMSGTLAGDAPGPSTYWIDAVIELSPDVAATLRAKATTELPAPAVEADVASAIPTGALMGGPEVDAAFAQGQFRAKAYLVDGTDTVVIEALGQ